MEFIFLEFVNYSISASWFILAILILRPFLKKTPKWVNPILWCLVGIRLFLPFSIESSISLIPSAETLSPTILYEKAPTIQSNIPLVDEIVNGIGTNNMELETEVVETSVSSMQSVVFILSIIWIIGIVFMLVYASGSYAYIKHKVKTAIKFQDNIYQCEHIGTPFVLGFLHPRIYLPFCIEENMLEYVIAHEKAHIIRRDHWLKPIAFFVLSIYWFNPFVWVAYVLLCKDIELACDERTINDLAPSKRADYSEVLLFYSDNAHMRKMIMVCPLAFGEVAVKERVRNVLSYKKPAFWIIGMAVVSCCIMGVCFLTNPKTKTNAKAPFDVLYEVAAPVYGFDEPSLFPISENRPAQFYIYNNILYMRNDLLIPQKENIWMEVGELQELEMKEKLFDQYFSYDSNWTGFHSAKKLRLNNEKIWRVIYEEKKYDESYCMLPPTYYMYYIILQKDGSVYMASGEFDYGEGGSKWDDSYFLLAFQLKECDIQEEKKQNVIECCQLAAVKVTEEARIMNEIRRSLEKRRYIITPEANISRYKNWLQRMEDKMYEIMER